MKLLIVTAWYHPFIHPRAHRWTALAEHWAATGHEVHVVTARHRDCPDEAVVSGVRVQRAGFDSLKEVVYYYFGSKNARGRVGVLPKKPGVFTRLATWLYNAVWKKIYFPDDACLWYFPAKKKARQLLEQEKFDALITVSLPFTGHLIGLRLRNFESFVNGQTVWLADIGDPFSIQAKPLNNNFLYGKTSRRLEQKVLENADAATVTTEFALKKYREQFGEKAVAKTHVIPPLLHPAPNPQTLKPSNPQTLKPPNPQTLKPSNPQTLKPPNPQTLKPSNPQTLKPSNLQTLKPSNPQTLKPSNPQTLKLAYFGALYASVRTPDVLLDLLEKMFALRPDLKGKIEVHFYGEIFPEFFKKLAAQPAIRLHGLRPREEVQAAMRDMDILLNIGNTTDFQLPSKAVEYLAAGRPILNLSYTDDDPFAAFFGGNDLVFSLKIKNGRVGEEEVRRWLVWLEGEKEMPSEADLERAIAPYRVEAIARRYLDLLAGESASRMI
ncbi:MAG: glycosyltransferase [Saprospiraceae bacterium]|nr:glycosyltransferase [Saprospiraceae bacterium]